MKIRMTLEVDSDVFGKFNHLDQADFGRKDHAAGTTLDLLSLDEISYMADDAKDGGNGLLKESKLVKIERCGESWEPQSEVTS